MQCDALPRHRAGQGLETLKQPHLGRCKTLRRRLGGRLVWLPVWTTASVDVSVAALKAGGVSVALLRTSAPPRDLTAGSHADQGSCIVRLAPSNATPNHGVVGRQRWLACSVWP